MSVDKLDQVVAGPLVGGCNQSADAGVQRLPGQAGDRASGGLAERDAGGEVDVVAQVPVGET